jgi:hypothetical protein
VNNPVGRFIATKASDWIGLFAPEQKNTIGTEETPGVLVVSPPAKVGVTGRITRRPTMKAGTQSLGDMSTHLEYPVKLTSIGKPQKPLQSRLDKR